MSAILPILIGAVVTGIVGNLLVQRWQLRSWYAQQRQLGHQAELEALKALVEELTDASGRRLSVMMKLVGSLSPEVRADTLKYLEEYRDILDLWNRSLNSFYVRITLYIDYSMTRTLEIDVHHRFVAIGQDLEAQIRAVLAGKPPSRPVLASLSERLSSLTGVLFNFNRDILRSVQQRRAAIYGGRRLAYNRDHLDEYSFLDLVKALFITNVDSFYVVRPA